MAYFLTTLGAGFPHSKEQEFRIFSPEKGGKIILNIAKNKETLGAVLCPESGVQRALQI